MPTMHAKTMWGLLGLLLLIGCGRGGGGEVDGPSGSAQDDVFAGTTANPHGNPLEDNALARRAALNPSAGAYFGDSGDTDQQGAGDWVVEDYEIQIAQAASISGVVERNRATGETRIRYFDIEDLGVDFRGLGGQEINLAPSNFTPPGDDPWLPAGREDKPLFGSEGEELVRPRNFDAQWKSIMADLERSLLAQVATNPFPENWIEDIASRKPLIWTDRARTWQRATAVPNASKLTVGEGDDLPLKAMEASVRIDGFRARVVLDLFFENDRDKQLEGNFKLRLPNGAVPYYLAFGETKLKTPTFTESAATAIGDIRALRETSWEAPKEARVVQRETAAYAYGETVRRKVDPALLEWAGAGIFETRVFPLLPNRMHRIVVGYEVDLVPLGDDLLYRLDLPADVPDVRIDLDVNGVSATVAPATTPMAGRYRWTNPDAAAIAVHVKDPGALLLRGRDPQVGEHVAVRLQPDLPAEPATGRARAVFLVDVSLSENPERFNVWLALMEQILERNRPTLREFAVAFFNIETFWWHEGLQANTPDNVAALRKFARQLVLEGATDLSQALSEASRIPGPADLFLLSNGAVTWGADDLSVLARSVPADCPVFSYTTHLAGTDRRVLEHLAQSTGGAVFSVSDEASLEKTAVAHRMPPWQIRAIRLDGCRDLMLRGDPRTLYAGQTLLLVGRGTPVPGAAVELQLVRENQTRTMRMPLSSRLTSPLAVGAYGRVAVDRLEALGGGAPRHATAYARHYRVVGRTCSLLMLETDADYERFDIRPEDDTQVIKEQGLADFVRAFVRENASALTDPRARLLRFLASVGRWSGIEAERPPALSRALDALSAEAFRVEVEPLRCKQHTCACVAVPYLDALRAHEASYDLVRREAAARVARLGAADGLKVLSSLVEEHPGDLAIARDIGRTAIEWDEPAQAYHILRRVAERRPYDLPMLLGIARCLAGMDRTDLALLYYEVALAASKAGHRFGAFADIAAVEYTRFLGEIESGKRETTLGDLAKTRRAELRKASGLIEADLVVVMAWNTDSTDVDLHVIDPTGEECFYSHPETKMGGRITQDVTTGFGPEMFVLKEAAPGTYEVRAKNYSSNANRTGVRSRVHLTIYEDFGRPTERVTRTSVLLQNPGEMIQVAKIERKPSGG